MQIAILGGGAAGFAAAIAAAQQGAQVRVLERNTKPLKKLGVTGNGRGNILNAGDLLYYGDTAFAKAVLARFGYAQLAAFFRGLGVPLRTEGEGRVYPAALLASVVQDALLLRASQLDIAVQCLARVTDVSCKGGRFTIRGTQSEMQGGKTTGEAPFAYDADKVIVACGGAAYPVHGTDGSAYALMTKLGHTCTPLAPALCALEVPKKRVQGLAGQRVRAVLTLTDASGSSVRQTQGEALFADGAVSGIAAMQLARFVKPGMQLHMDLRNELNIEQDPLAYLRFLGDMRPQVPVADLWAGTFAKPVARWILREAGIQDFQTPAAALAAGTLHRMAAVVQDLCLPVTGTRGFSAAQVTAGGIDTRDFSPDTMESARVPGLYAAGEVLNVDGECGGFNLMFAWASGLLAGQAAAVSPARR